MHAALKSLWLDPDPSTLSSDPAGFAFRVQMIVGPRNGPGEESFDLTVCTPQWLAREVDHGFYDARHHVIVNLQAFDKNALITWLTQRVERVQAATWTEIGERLSRLGHWEFEDYRA